MVYETLNFRQLYESQIDLYGGQEGHPPPPCYMPPVNTPFQVNRNGGEKGTVAEKGHPPPPAAAKGRRL